MTGRPDAVIIDIADDLFVAQYRELQAEVGAAMEALLVVQRCLNEDLMHHIAQRRHAGLQSAPEVDA